MIAPMLQVTQLNKRFGERHAVRSVSFGLERGQTLGLIGPNGAGKSTTVSMLCGLVQPDSGQVEINGVAMGLGRNPVKQWIGLVPQELALYEDLSAQENLKLFGALYGLRGQPLQRRPRDSAQGSPPDKPEKAPKASTKAESKPAGTDHANRVDEDTAKSTTPDRSQKMRPSPRPMRGGEAGNSPRCSHHPR